MSYFCDLINPLGAEYGATARAADSAEATQRAMDDMLALAMQPDEQSRQQVAQQIYDREQREAANAGRGRVLKYAMLALLAAFCVAVWQLGDDSSSLSGAYRAFMAWSPSQGPDASAAPVRAARAPDAQDSDDPDAIVARGEQVLHDSGMSNEQIYGNTQ